MNLPPRLTRFWAALWPWLILRLRQPSTWAGLLLKAAGLCGFVLTDSDAAHLAELLAVLVGAALFAYDQTPKPDPTDQAGA